MKLRLLGNKIRFRLSEPEVFALSEVHEIQSTLPINPSDSDNFRYSIHTSKNTFDPSVKFEKNKLRIDLPYDQVAKWAKSDQIGIEEVVLSNSGEELVILVEKDFQCLTSRDEDESKLFQNPNSGKSH